MGKKDETKKNFFDLLHLLFVVGKIFLNFIIWVFKISYLSSGEPIKSILLRMTDFIFYEC